LKIAFVNPFHLPLQKGGVTSPFVIFFLSKTGKRGIEGDFNGSRVPGLACKIYFKPQNIPPLSSPGM
jgi:hypothetical protein